MADCLARYPAYREELESLLRLTVRLQAARTLRASPEFQRLSAIRVGNLIAARQHQSERSVTRQGFLSQVRAVFRASKKLTGAIVTSSVLIASLLLGGGGSMLRPTICPATHASS